MSSALLVAWQGVRSRLGRSLLTALSLLVGVLAIIIIQAGAGAAQAAILVSSRLTSGLAVTVSALAPEGQQSITRSQSLQQTLSRALAPVGGVAVTLAETDASAGADMGTLSLVLVSGDIRSIRPYPVVAGTWLPSRSGTALPLALNRAAAARLDLTAGDVATLRINAVGERHRGTVVAVVDDGMRNDPRLYTPLDTAQPWVRALSFGTPVQILVHTPGEDEQTLKRLVAIEYARAFDTAAPDIQRLDQERQLATQMAVIRRIFTMVAGLSLIVGALGILNIGLATLKERSDELSLRRSFGATRGQVTAIVIIEGQIIALLATALALGAGLLAFPFAVSAISEGLVVTRQSFPLTAAGVGCGASALAALAGSIAPALRAARVPIASIMRN